MLNFAYLAGRARDIEQVGYIQIRSGATVEKGHRLTADDLEELRVPSNAQGNLKEVAYSWKDVGSVSGLPIYHTLTGPRVLLREDMRTPEVQLTLEKDER